MAWKALHKELAAHGFSPFSHNTQPEMSRDAGWRCFLWVIGSWQAHAIVFDLQVSSSRPGTQADPDLMGLGMLMDVGQGLLDDAEKVYLVPRREIRFSFYG
jgi:hypothetical protein